MVDDPRDRTKDWLDTYLDNDNVNRDTDNEVPARMIVLYGDSDYPLLRVFNKPKNVDLLFLVSKPDSQPLLSHDHVIYGYRESVPVKIMAVDKTGVDGLKLVWKGEAELRRIAETYPTGSLRLLRLSRDSKTRLGSTTLYSTEYKLSYVRDTT